MLPQHTPILEPYPETKPATEFIGGRLVQKRSLRGLYANVQAALAAALRSWAFDCGSGRIGTEWDFDVTPPGERTNRLVPDLAYLAFDRVSYEDEEAAQIPKVAPSAAFEILSPGQTMGDLAEKVRIFLAAGCEVVVVIDPREEYALVHDAVGVHRLGKEQDIAHPALPGFQVRLASVLKKIAPKKMS